MMMPVLRTGTILSPLLLASMSAAADRPVGSAPIGNQVVDLTPPVPRPDARRCVVTLFDRREFSGETPLPLAYRPPADCPGPWQKVVLEADFDVTAGHQYDRTADLTLGGATLFAGTTMEPGDDYAPHWHVERDVTDFAALLRQPTDGVATLANHLDETHDGRIVWGARLVFYAGAAPELNRVVLPVTSGFVRVDSKQPGLSRTLTLPRNLTRLEMDLFAIGQDRDEFWYDCVPAGFAKPNPFTPTPCPSPYREVEVRIDGRLAGLRAVQPIVFTGGINPAWWRRAPDLHALNLPSTRLDLTPFAGLLNDGKPHEVALSMPAVGSFFRVSAALIGDVDPTRPVVMGAVVANTLAPASVSTHQMRPSQRPDLTGTLRTTAGRSGYIEGYVSTGRGRVTTRVAYALDTTLTGVRDTGRSDKTYDAHQSMTVTVTGLGARPRRRRVEEKDRLTIEWPVDPPLYGEKYGMRISHAVQHDISDDRDDTGTGTTAQSIISFAPGFSVFTAPRATPNRVTVTAVIRDARGRCHETEAHVSDDTMQRIKNVPCS